MKAQAQYRKADRESRGSCDDFLRRKSEGGGGASASTDRRSVFVSGSRSQAVISKVVQDSLEAIMSSGFNILIEDSNKGVEKGTVDFLRVPLYENIALYSVSPKDDAATVKAEKIMRQYRKLLRTELQEASASSTEGDSRLDAPNALELDFVQDALPMF